MKKPHRKSASRPDFKKGLREKLKIKKSQDFIVGLKSPNQGLTRQVFYCSLVPRRGICGEERRETVMVLSQMGDFLQPRLLPYSHLQVFGWSWGIRLKCQPRLYETKTANRKNCCLGKRRLRKRTFFCRTTAILGKFTVVNGSVRVSIKNSD